MTLNRLRALGGLGALGVAALSGCAITPLGEPYPYPYGPEAYGQPYYGQPATTVWVEPPPPVYRVVPPSPYVGGLWIEGTWIHDHGRRVWHPGRWVPPGHGHRGPPPHFHDRRPPHLDERPPAHGGRPGQRPGWDDRRGPPPDRGVGERGIAPAWGTPVPPPHGARGPRGGGEHRMRIPRQPETPP